MTEASMISVAPALLSRDAAAAFMGVPLSTFEERVQSGAFPKPRQVSNKRVGWLTHELALCAAALPVSTFLPPKNCHVGRKGKPKQATQGDQPAE